MLRPIIGPLVNAPLRGVTDPGFGGSFSPNAAFFAGAPGVAYDLSDASKLYVDSARTVQVATAGDLIGSVTDLSGNGYHASQATGGQKASWQTTYALFDGVDDGLATPSINFTGTDKVTVVVGLRKLSDAAAGSFVELGTSGANTFGGRAPVSAAANNYNAMSAGSAVAQANVTEASVAAPNTSVIATLGDIAADSLVMRINGVQRATSAADQGAGTYQNGILYIGRRGGTALPFNGRIYRMIVIGRALNATELARAEKWCAAPAGIVLP